MGQTDAGLAKRKATERKRFKTKPSRIPSDFQIGEDMFFGGARLHRSEVGVREEHRGGREEETVA